jgi:hypothetical protein
MRYGVMTLDQKKLLGLGCAALFIVFALICGANTSGPANPPTAATPATVPAKAESEIFIVAQCHHLGMGDQMVPLTFDAVKTKEATSHQKGGGEHHDIQLSAAA